AEGSIAFFPRQKTRADDEPPDNRKRGRDDPQVAKYALDRGSTLSAKDKMLNGELETQTDCACCERCKDEHRNEPSSFAILPGKQSSPTRPKIDEHRDHRSRVHHDEQKGHFRRCRIKAKDLLQKNDMC